MLGNARGLSVVRVVDPSCPRCHAQLEWWQDRELCPKCVDQDIRDHVAALFVEIRKDLNLLQDP